LESGKPLRKIGKPLRKIRKPLWKVEMCQRKQKAVEEIGKPSKFYWISWKSESH
jgi:hypothetical protein